jgi:hypothetical protein
MYGSVVIMQVQEFVRTCVVVWNDIYGILTLSSMKRARRGSEGRDTTFHTTTQKTFRLSKSPGNAYPSIWREVKRWEVGLVSGYQ